MAPDDDWETDADYENTLTEAETRAFGNRETMDKYSTLMGTSAIAGSAGPLSTRERTSIAAQGRGRRLFC